MTTRRMAITVEDDRGIYRIVGARTYPLGRILAEAEYARGPLHMLHFVEPLICWGRWRWAISLGASDVDLFVDGDDPPDDIHCDRTDCPDISAHCISGCA